MIEKVYWPRYTVIVEYGGDPDHGSRYLSDREFAKLIKYLNRDCPRPHKRELYFLHHCTRLYHCPFATCDTHFGYPTILNWVEHFKYDHKLTAKEMIFHFHKLFVEKVEWLVVDHHVQRREPYIIEN